MCFLVHLVNVKTLHRGLEKPSAFILSLLNMCLRMKSVYSVYSYLEICLASRGRPIPQASSSDGPGQAKPVPGPQLGLALPRGPPTLLSLKEGTLDPVEQSLVYNTPPHTHTHPSQPWPNGLDPVNSTNPGITAATEDCFSPCNLLQCDPLPQRPHPKI